MKQQIRSMSRQAVTRTFGTIYILALLMAVFPPFYLAASGQSWQVLWMPFSVFYWLFDFVLLLGSLTLFYWVEDIRGELEESNTPRGEVN